jgi:hypothetical protein
VNKPPHYATLRSSACSSTELQRNKTAFFGLNFFLWNMLPKNIFFKSSHKLSQGRSSGSIQVEGIETDGRWWEAGDAWQNSSNPQA